MRTHPGRDRPPDYEEDRIVAISIVERDGQTLAMARLSCVDRECVGVGLSGLSAAEHNFEGVGGELAIARALSDLGRRLVAQRYDEDTR